MWPFLALVGLGLGAWALWQASQTPGREAPPPPVLGAYRTPSGNPTTDGPIFARSTTLLGVLAMVGPCATSPTVPTDAAGLANFARLVALRTRAVWHFQQAVGLPTTGCYDTNTANAGYTWGPSDPNARFDGATWPPPCSCGGATVIPEPPEPSGAPPV